METKINISKNAILSVILLISSLSSQASSSGEGPSGIHGEASYSLYSELQKFSPSDHSCVKDLQDWTRFPFVTLDGEDTSFKEDAFYAERLPDDSYLLAVALSRYARQPDETPNPETSLDFNKEQISYVAILILKKISTNNVMLQNIYFAEAVIKNVGAYICEGSKNPLINPCIKNARGKPINEEQCELIKGKGAEKTLYYNVPLSPVEERKVYYQKELLEEIYSLFHKNHQNTPCSKIVSSNINLSRHALYALSNELKIPTPLNRKIRNEDSKDYDLKEVTGQRILANMCGWDYEKFQVKRAEDSNPHFEPRGGEEISSV